MVTMVPEILLPMMLLDLRAATLLVVLLAVLGLAYFVAHLLQRRPNSSVNPAVIRIFAERILGWWMIYAGLGATFLLGATPTVVLFFGISFWALREFITLTPTRMGDHRALFWVFFIFAPLQYVMVGVGWKQYRLLGAEFDVYQFASNLIPIFAFLFIPARIAMAGDYKRFLERVAKIQCGLMICVFCLSHAPALLNLKLTNVDLQPWQGSRAGVLFFFILICQAGDLMQFLWGRIFGRHVIAPEINASKTWAGVLGGTMTTTLIGTALWWITPFPPLEAGGLALVIAVMGIAGSLTMSAIKRDRGVKDYGTLVEGHAGVLDRIDSICFAAPVFYHLVRYFYT